ncbi:MacS family sensor histidine kinase [Streptomyces sp. TR06-5]|uniref:MacS family sensor histidine kinase n=1 Tax=unclassified Streptomyces TaxID=2593676 RepID=UPI00399F4105
MRSMPARMSVEQPLWRALTAYRLLTAAYAVGLCVLAHEHYLRPRVAVAYFAVLVVWTLGTVTRTLSESRCRYPFLVGEMAVALSGILLTALVETPERIASGVHTLPSVWTAGAVLGFAIKGGWRPAAAASALVGAANLLERGAWSRDTVHNVLLVCVASIAIGYVVEVARASERTLARALQIEAATRERERLARDIHDSVLQVLAMVQRRGSSLGGEAAELGRLAGEQEHALRALVSSRGDALPRQNGPELAARGRAGSGDGAGPEEDGPYDLRRTLAAYGSARVTFAEPGTPVLLAAEPARQLAAAVGAALDNVRRHAGEAAHAWILLEDEADTVVVTVRDDGPGIPAGRLAAAEAEGRMGVALSIRGRLAELGGSAEWMAVPGQGTEVELRVPKDV